MKEEVIKDGRIGMLLQKWHTTSIADSIAYLSKQTNLIDYIIALE